jgi:glycosyltransferase involved in cell wall biosynthesis
MEPPVSGGPGPGPRFTILTVCRNSGRTIRRTLESVLGQTVPPEEYILVDGLSSDATPDIIREYAGAFESKGVRFRWTSEKDGGIYDAMNKGIAQAGGDIIGIINSDDWYEPDAVERVAEAQRLHPDGGVFYGFLRVMTEGRELAVLRYNFDAFLLHRETGIYNSAQHPSCFVHRRVYRTVGCFDTDFPIAADYDFLIRAARTGIVFVPIDRVLANFSKGGANDRMTEAERFSQRYRIWFKNGLADEAEYARLIRQTRYTRLKRWKNLLVRGVFGFRSEE